MARANKSKRLKVKAANMLRGVIDRYGLNGVCLSWYFGHAYGYLFLTFKGFGWVHDQFYADNPRYEIQHLIIESNGSSCR